MDQAVELFIVTFVRVHGPYARCLIVMAPGESRYEVTVPHKLPRAARPPPPAAA